MNYSCDRSRYVDCNGLKIMVNVFLDITNSKRCIFCGIMKVDNKYPYGHVTSRCTVCDKLQQFYKCILAHHNYHRLSIKCFMCGKLKKYKQ